MLPLAIAPNVKDVLNVLTTIHELGISQVVCAGMWCDCFLAYESILL